jgi:hypothetical protein
MNAVLSIAYLPPIQYFTKLYKYTDVFIEDDENYNKQSYRNRCLILSANSTQTLSVPVCKPHKQKANIKDIRIDYTKAWQRNHWRAIEAAYSSSPFFEFYKDELLPFYEKNYEFLFDLNIDLIYLLSGLTGVSVHLNFTGTYHKQPSEHIDDFRENIHPKRRMQKSDPDFKPEPYHQVFSERFGFVSNLSIIDLLFNKGPETEQILKLSTY